MEEFDGTRNGSGQSGMRNPPSSVVERIPNHRTPSTEEGPSNGSSGQEEPSEKAVNFNGPRQQPTPSDYQELVKCLERYIAKAKAGEIHSIGIVCGRPNESPLAEALLLHGSNGYEVIGGLQMLAIEMQLSCIIDVQIDRKFAGIMDQLGI